MTRDSSDAIRTLVEKRKQRRYVVEETLRLIDKAEEKRRYDKEGRRRWTRILVRLEDSLFEAKKAVAECDTLISIEQDRTGVAAVEPAQAGAAVRTEAESLVKDADPERRAAYRIAETPVEELADISLQDAAFARAYMERRGFDAHDAAFKKTLTAKLELASQLPHAREARREQGERRNQLVLREAIGKVQAGQIEQMSDNDVELLVNCYTVLRDKIVPTESNKRLLAIISQTIGDLRAEGARRRLFSR